MALRGFVVLHWGMAFSEWSYGWMDDGNEWMNWDHEMVERGHGLEGWNIKNGLNNK